MSNMNFTSLSHSVNSSGRLGMFVDPHSCSCEGCHDYLADHTGVDETPGLSNLPPRPSALSLERQTAAPHNSTDGSPVVSPLSHSSSVLSPLAPSLSQSLPSSLPQRSNGGGIPFPPTLEASPTGLGNWRALFRESRFEPETTISVDLKDEIAEHLNQYLIMLEKHQKVMEAKLDLYAFLLEDASVRLRLEAFNKKINSLKATLGKLD